MKNSNRVFLNKMKNVFIRSSKAGAGVLRLGLSILVTFYSFSSVADAPSSHSGPIDTLAQRADVKRDEAITKLEELIDRYTEGAQKAELLFRLSEKYWAKARFYRLQAMEQWEAEIDAYEQAGRKGKEPLLENTEGYAPFKDSEAKALGLYRRILSDYRRYHRNDEVLYNLGSALYHREQAQAGMSYFRRLIQSFPKSPRVGDAWLQIGEHAFENNRLDEAVEAYEYAMASGETRIHAVALYKLAWCDLNLGRYHQSIARFKKVVWLAEQSEGETARHRIQLSEEAFSDMARAYAAQGIVGPAVRYYQETLGHQKAYSYVVGLAERYARHADTIHEIETYRVLVRDYPFAPMAPVHQLSVMTGLAKGGDVQALQHETKTFLERFRADSDWDRHQQPYLLNAFKDGWVTLEERLGDFAIAQHQVAQRTKSVERYRLVRDLYRDYLDKFPNVNRSNLFKYSYANTLFELKEYTEAAPIFDDIVVNRAPKKYVADAAYWAVLAWENVLDGEAKNGSKNEQPATLSINEKHLLDAYQRFASESSDEDAVVKALFKSARLYEQNQKTDLATEVFKNLIEGFAKHRLAREAAISVLDTIKAREDWSNLNIWARRFSERQDLVTNRAFEIQIQEYIQGASFNEIHDVFEKNESPKQIGRRYQAYEEEFPQSTYAMTALYNAALYFERGRDVLSALNMASRILTRYDRRQSAAVSDEGRGNLSADEIIRRTLLLKASLHESISEWKEAADIYIAFVKRFKSDAKRQDALYNAALYYRGSAQEMTAMRLLKQYIEEYPNAPDIEALRWRYGEWLASSKDARSAYRYFSRFAKRKDLDSARRVCAHFESLKALSTSRGSRGSVRMQRWADLYASFQNLKPEKQQDVCARRAGAEALFNQLKGVSDSFLSINLPATRETVLPRKVTMAQRQLVDLESSFTRLLEIGDPEFSLIALYSIGAANQHLSAGLSNISCPKAFNEDQCMIFQDRLYEAALPYEEKAISVFKNLVEKSLELKLYTPVVKNAQASVAIYEAKPERFLRDFAVGGAPIAQPMPQLVGMDNMRLQMPSQKGVGP